MSARTEIHESATLRRAGLAFILAPATFILAQVGQTIFGTWPPDSSISLFFYSMEIVWPVLLALGVTASLIAVPALRGGTAGYFATGFLWIAALSVILTFRDAAIDLMLVDTRGTDLFPPGERWWTYEAAHTNLLLVGAGIAFLGRALTRSGLTRRFLGYTGVVLGALTFLVTYIRLILLGAFWAEPFPVLLLTFAWLIAIGILMYRRAGAETAAPFPVDNE